MELAKTIACGSLLALTATLRPVMAGEIDWRSCGEEIQAEGARCGVYRVFENRQAASGRQIGIHLMVLPQTGDGPPKPPLWLLAGGPGQGGTAMVRFGTSDEATVLRGERDIVMADQRGTGGSNPLDCRVPGVDRDPRPVFGHLFPPENLRRCRAELETRANLGLYTTELAADDFDELRQALGYDQVALWGVSYGTRFAGVWQQRHPETIAAMVLDSAAPVSMKAPLYYARDAQRSLDKVISACAADAACLGAMPDLATDLDRVLGRFEGGTVGARVTPQAGGEPVEVALSRGDLGYAIRGLLYRPDALPLVAGMLHRAAESGDLSPFAQAYYDRWMGLEPAVSIGLHLSVFCAEDTWRISDAEAAVATQGTYLGEHLTRVYREGCREWPRGEVSEAYWRPRSHDLPVLILNGDLDPITPPAWGRESARPYPNSRHVVFSAASHGLTGRDCGQGMVAAFFDELRLDDIEASCAYSRLAFEPEEPAGG